jgi:hypothetical protein
VGINAAAGIDYLIGEANQCGRGVGSAAIASFTPRLFPWYPDVEVIMAAPQADWHSTVDFRSLIHLAPARGTSAADLL